jgi:O-antigen ligase
LVGIAVARRLPGAARNKVGFWLTAGVVAALAALATEYYSDGLLGRLLYKMETPLLDRHRFNRGVTIVALMSLPALLWLWQGGRRVASLALALAAFWLFKHMDSLATTYGFLGACLLFLLARRWPRAVAWGLAGALVLAVVALPLLASHLEPLIGLDVPPSRWSPIYEKMRTRFLIWNFVWQRIGEQPWLGWGMDASRYVPGGAETLPDRPTNVLPLHPHNGLLQLWLELGIVGYLAGTGAALLAVRRLIGTGWPEDAQAAGLALVAYIGLFAMVSYGLWQSWWLAAVGLAATFLAAVTPVSAERGNSGPA